MRTLLSCTRRGWPATSDKKNQRYGKHEQSEKDKQSEPAARRKRDIRHRSASASDRWYANEVGHGAGERALTDAGRKSQSRPPGHIRRQSSPFPGLAAGAAVESECLDQSFTSFFQVGRFFPNFGRQILEKDGERMLTHENNNQPQILRVAGSLPSLALLLAAVTLLAFAPQSARAGAEMPFHANFITHFESVLEFPLLHVTVNARGTGDLHG